MTKIKFVLGILSMLLITAAPAIAQDATGTASATAEIAGTATVSSTDLTFGTGLAQGTPVTVAPTDASAAHFTVTGTTGAEVDATFTLPTTGLIHDGDGTTTLPITFSATSAAWALASGSQGTSTAYDPSTILTQTLDATSGELHIWLGGEITPAADQKPGSYSGDITLDIAYTGL